MDIKVNFHSSVLINNKIFIDPLRVDGVIKPEFIFITHSHWDHYSKEDINKIVTDKAIIICPLSMKSDIENQFKCQVYFVEPDKEYTINGLSFKTFASYNLNKKFHPKKNMWVGYTIFIDGQSITVTGDSDNTPELQTIKTDILLLPIGGIYTMTVSEAAQLTNIIKPKLVIPIHYGEIVGNPPMGQKFKKLIDPQINCEIQL